VINRVTRAKGATRVGLILAAVIVASAQAAPPDLFDEIYQRGRPLEANLRTLTARFTETTTSSLLTQPLVARGTLAVVRPTRVVLRYDEPDQRTVLIDGDLMRLVWPARRLDQRTNIGASQRRIQQYFVDKSPDQLRSHFDIRAEVPADRPSAWLITMTPKRRQIREGLSRLELWLDRTTVMLTAMRMTFPNRDTKLMDFEDVRVNPTIDPALFHITTP
jgi:outer membrane lipoprotein-sorting protein